MVRLRFIQKALSARQQRRKQLRPFEKLKKKGNLPSFSATPNESGFQLTYNFSNTVATDINASVSARLFDVPKAAILQLELDARSHNILYNSVPQTLDSLFSFNSDQKYLSLLADAVRHAQELRQVTSNGLTNPYALKLKQAELPDVDAIEKEFHREHAKKLRLKPGQISSSFKAAAEAYCAGIAKMKDAVQKNEPIFSTSLRVSDSLETIVADVEQVAREGSPKAAYLYFTRLVRITLPDNAEHRGEFAFNNLYRFSANIKRKNNRLFKLLRLTSMLDLSRYYVDIGKLGLDNILLVLDQEEKRTRYGSRTRHVRSNVFNFVYTPSEIIGFAETLGKIGAQPQSVADLLSEVPIGQRKSTFKALNKDPGIVKLYEQLKEHGVDARTYISFASELAGVEVRVNGETLTLQKVVSRIASDEKQRSGAAWLVRHPEVWARSDLAQIIGLAGTRYSEMKLELYNKWSSDPLKSNVVLELAPQLSPEELRELATALLNIDRAYLKFVPSLTLDIILSLQKPEQTWQAASPPIESETKERPERVRNRVLWANIAYPDNLGLVSAVLHAYEVVPVHRQHRIKEVDEYVRDNYRHQGQTGMEAVLLNYFSKIGGMTPRLAAHVFGSPDEQLFNSFLRRLPEEGFVEMLEDKVKNGSNPYQELYGVLVHEQKALSPRHISQQIAAAAIGKLGQMDSPDSDDNLVSADGVVYRIAVLGAFDSRKQRLIESKLAGIGIELLFFSNEKEIRGTYPDCDGVAIFKGSTSVSGGLAHSSAVRSYYDKHNYPITVRGISRNADIVADALIEFRDQLVLNGRQNFSA